MRILRALTIAASVAITSLTLPPVAIGMECRDLCFNFYPPPSLLSEHGDERDRCQHRINESGGFCTIHGKLNLGLDLPRGIGYKPQNYRDIRKYYWDVYGIRIR